MTQHRYGTNADRFDDRLYRLVLAVSVEDIPVKLTALEKMFGIALVEIASERGLIRLVDRIVPGDLGFAVTDKGADWLYWEQ